MAETKTPILETKKLGITFGGLKAVQDFNIQICQGELVGLIGPNGAGKTTLMRILCGIVSPTRGHVLVDGRDIAAPPAGSQPVEPTLEDGYMALASDDRARA